MPPSPTNRLQQPKIQQRPPSAFPNPLDLEVPSSSPSGNVVEIHQIPPKVMCP